jgi:Luciferase-like monooxygenase
MGKLDFAFWDVIPHSATGAGIADEYDAHIRQAQHIEALGWHSYFVIEHQNTPQGTSSPSVYLTAVARETSTLSFAACKLASSEWATTCSAPTIRSVECHPRWWLGRSSCSAKKSSPRSQTHPRSHPE